MPVIKAVGSNDSDLASMKNGSCKKSKLRLTHVKIILGVIVSTLTALAA